ncbi:ferredoxin [Streptomyces sp. NPDC059906]|uniref:ferredoxin n=1 Tax=Streptomyces sp. NPDC059906 TaxID=3346997 RepID=UPI0036639553
MRLFLSTDTGKCCSSGQCVAALPEIFDQDDTDGRVVLLVEHAPSALSRELYEAVDCCPAGAITVREEAESIPEVTREETRGQ